MGAGFFSGSPKISSNVVPDVAAGAGVVICGAAAANPARLPDDALRRPGGLLGGRQPSELLRWWTPNMFGGSIGTGSKPITMLERTALLTRR